MKITTVIPKKTVLALAVAAGFWAQAAETVDLDGAWKLTTFPQPVDGAVRALPLPSGLATRTYAATVPGCCEMELVKAGELPDPYVSTNALAFRAVYGNQWLYERTFDCPKRAPGERVVLVFDGIDTLADVFLNGKRIGTAENMLIPHEFDVTDKVRTGAVNALAVLIRPVCLAARERVVGELGATMSGGADHDAFRKAPYMYGWDTMPHLPVSGIWRDVRLEVRAVDRLEDVAWIVSDVNVKARTAGVGFKCRVNAPYDRLYAAKLRLSVSRNGKTLGSRTEPLISFNQREMFTCTDAEFWWPRGMGESALCDAKAELVAADGKVLAVDERKIGLRTIALEYDDRKLPERPGRFLFKVNGEPVFVRGVDWIPLDPIPSEQKRRLPKALAMMADLNANLVRVWGGGVYEPEEFFAWCDANGVMVWQDFMNACAVPPQDPEFQRLMREEALSVVRRFRNHPSIALWAGDNENDQAVSWSFGRKVAMDPNDNVITRQVLPSVVREYDVTRPYLPSSPFVSRDAFAGRTEPCEDHLWGGPRAWWKTKYYTDNSCWFCSEGGAHALPARSTLEKVIPAEDLKRPWFNPDEKDPLKMRWTDQWEHRATNPHISRTKYPHNRNLLVLKQTSALFGDVPRDDLDLFIEQSQCAQAEGIKFQVEMFRSQKFLKKGGFVVWNLTDGWPTISDAVSDSYGVPKKSFFELKDSYRNVIPVVTEDGRLAVVNDTRAEVRGRVVVTEAKDGKRVCELDYVAPANAVTEVSRVGWDGQGMFRIDYTVGDAALKARYLHGEPPFKWAEYKSWLETVAK